MESGPHTPQNPKASAPAPGGAPIAASDSSDTSESSATRSAVMTCFEWQSRCSDYLDGTLIGPIKQAADDHLDSCKDCSERHQHYRLILTSIASQPRVSLPPELRASPLPALLPAAEVARSTRYRWAQIPWLLRTTLEGTGIVLLILVVISTGPKLRALYENRIEQNLNEFTENLGENAEIGATGTEVAAVPLQRGKVTEISEESEGDEFGGEVEEESPDLASHDTAGDNLQLQVGLSEIWRFNMKTDSPHDVRPQIVKALLDLRVPANTPGIGGIEAPGGIQFDLLVSRSVVLDLRRQLQKLAPKNLPGSRPKIADDSGSNESFTWFKNKSKRKMPESKARVVIWLSQM